MALSGTPFENNVLELWSVMRLLNPKIFSKRAFFTRAVEEKDFDRIKKAIAPFMLQRKKKDVLRICQRKRKKSSSAEWTTRRPPATAPSIQES